MAKQVLDADIRDDILEWLKDNERDLAWLSRKTGIVYATLYSCFIQRLFKVSDENLAKINEALETEFKATA
jgi:lambda repressor-like predicted transcriptional regulator